MEGRSDRVKPGLYDLSMSRRTRRPTTIAAIKASPERDGECGMDSHSAHRPSLKDLLKEGSGEDGVGFTGGAAEAKAEADQAAATAGEEKLLPLPCGGANGSNLLLREEKHLQMVKAHSGADGVKLARMVSRCVKVFNHLVKTRSGSKKKTTVQLLK